MKSVLVTNSTIKKEMCRMRRTEHSAGWIQNPGGQWVSDQNLLGGRRWALGLRHRRSDGGDTALPLGSWVLWEKHPVTVPAFRPECADK